MAGDVVTKITIVETKEPVPEDIVAEALHDGMISAQRSQMASRLDDDRADNFTPTVMNLIEQARLPSYYKFGAL